MRGQQLRKKQFAKSDAFLKKEYLKNFTMDCVLEDINDDSYDDEISNEIVAERVHTECH